MTRRRILAAAILALAGILALWWLSGSGRNDAGPAARTTVASPAPLAAKAPSEISNLRSQIPPSPLADALNAPGADIHADLRAVAEILDTFRSNFPREGNPVGSNAEITAALSGDNRLRLVLIPRDHPAINRDGELCDRWGTPFFFHAESATRMEIRSAGPDRRRWTDDDVVFTP